MVASIILGLAGLVLLALGFAVLLVLPWRRHPAELGQTPLCQVFCTGEVVSESATANFAPPLWRVTLYSNFVVIANVRATKLTYSQVQSAVWISGRQPNELQLAFDPPPMRLTLHPRHPRLIMALLREKGIHHGWEPFVESFHQPVD